MAGRGKAPKAVGDRRNKTAPQRGDWVELRPIEKPNVPALPARGKGRGRWSIRTTRAWRAWWSDPASTQWGEADRDLVEHLADVYEAFVREASASLAAEIRQLRDSLGLTPKGRQDRRWVIVVGEVVDLEAEREQRAPAKRRLRAVDPAAAR